MENEDPMLDQEPEMVPESIPEGEDPIPDEDPVDMPLDSDLDEPEVMDDDPVHSAVDVPEITPDEDIEEKVQQATDRIREEFKQANIARAKCRHIVGDAMNCDTAEDIYRLALDQMGVKHDAIFGFHALSQMFDVANRLNTQTAPVKRAADGANSAAKRFPGLSRFQKM